MANTLIKNTVAPGTGGSGGGGGGSGGSGAGGSGGGGLPPIGSTCRAAVDAVIEGLFPGMQPMSAGGGGGGGGVAFVVPDGSSWAVYGARCENGYVSLDYRGGSIRSD